MIRLVSQREGEIQTVKNKLKRILIEAMFRATEELKIETPTQVGR